VRGRNVPAKANSIGRDWRESVPLRRKIVIIAGGRRDFRRPARNLCSRASSARAAREAVELQRRTLGDVLEVRQAVFARRQKIRHHLGRDHFAGGRPTPRGRLACRSSRATAGRCRRRRDCPRLARRCLRLTIAMQHPCAGGLLGEARASTLRRTRSAGSPISRAASASASMASGSGGASTNSGAMPQSPRHSRRVSATLLRELVSSAMRFTNLEWAFLRAAEGCGLRFWRRSPSPAASPCRRFADIRPAGMMAMSASPARRASAQSEGHRERQVVTALERTVREAPDERRGVEEFDDGDAQFAHVC
jgi:hypothetical protein